MKQIFLVLIAIFSLVACSSEDGNNQENINYDLLLVVFVIIFFIYKTFKAFYKDYKADEIDIKNGLENKFKTLINKLNQFAFNNEGVVNNTCNRGFNLYKKGSPQIILFYYSTGILSIEWKVKHQNQELILNEKIDKAKDILEPELKQYAEWLIEEFVERYLPFKDRIDSEIKIVNDALNEENDILINQLNQVELDDIINEFIEVIKNHKIRFIQTHPDEEDNIIFEFLDDIEAICNRIIFLSGSLTNLHWISLLENPKVIYIKNDLEVNLKDKLYSVSVWFEDVYKDDIKKFIEEQILYSYSKLTKLNG